MFVLKTYLKKDNINFLREEKQLRMLRQSQGLVGFYGTYVQGSNLNIVLEYTDQGSLEDYFQAVKPPETFDEIFHFWAGLFKTIDALAAIHEFKSTIDADRQLISKG